MRPGWRETSLSSTYCCEDSKLKCRFENRIEQLFQTSLSNIAYRSNVISDKNCAKLEVYAWSLIHSGTELISTEEDGSRRFPPSPKQNATIDIGT